MTIRDGIEACHLWDFIAESNRIEGITTRDQDPTKQVSIYEDLLALPSIGIADLVRFVDKIEPGAELRAAPGQNVMIGSHIPPAGGPGIVDSLDRILKAANEPVYGTWRGDVGESSYYVHVDYENLHPFMDGNGRSGRALWAWMMKRGGYKLERGFLHQFYYQALDNADTRK